MLQEFVQQVENTAMAVLDGVHTALPGKIVSVNLSKGTVSAKPIGEFTTADNKRLEYPVITDAPVVMPFCTGLGVGVAFPIKPKDSCLIVVSEVELDEWRTGAKSDACLRFDLTSAVVIPGMLKKSNALIKEAYNDKSVVIGNKTNKISIKENGIDISANGTELTVNGSGVSLYGDLLMYGKIIYPET